ncbi:MAG: ABC transporter ATP-binding protein, partial [Synechococcales cyanobacterium RU_4_20]|nr:ABC transporter ATP-binding protein [Synechococcales cyanobacterium RU_4_20]
LAASAASLSLSLYLRDCLGLQWRRWLTDKILGRYLSGQTFYKISNPTVIKNATIDNPDQRIAEDIKVFTQVSLTVFLIFLDSIVQLLGFIGVLWFISKSLTFFLVIYAVLGSAIATFFLVRR